MFALRWEVLQLCRSALISLADMVLAPSVAGLFKWRQFEPEMILFAVGWYLRFSLSYRDVEELLAERGLLVDHVTVWRWVQRYEGTTEVVYFPNRPGPIEKSEPATGPELRYKGPEGSFTFFSDVTHKSLRSCESCRLVALSHS